MRHLLILDFRLIVTWQRRPARNGNEANGGRNENFSFRLALSFCHKMHALKSIGNSNTNILIDTHVLFMTCYKLNSVRLHHQR